jgi:CDP-glucose 4,6-dehydratase
MSFWRGRRVFLTGHTGFKGSWLALWLADLGAQVTGFALAPPTSPSLFVLAGVAGAVTSIEGDVRDPGALAAAMEACDPEVVFHLAAQSLVRASYESPVETYATNVMGTVNVLEAVRRHGGVGAVICVTSDKCYENREWPWGYREYEPMGGHDPYSSSKGCAELVVSAYRHSFFNPEGEGGAQVATARAGNVIGGGDWAKDRLVPDIMCAFLEGRTPEIRHPGSIRPWQHVLEPLAGYLQLAECLWNGETHAAGAWNFGPSDDDARPVAWIADFLAQAWGEGAGWRSTAEPQPREATVLKLDSSRAKGILGWRPVWVLEDGLAETVTWYRSLRERADIGRVCVDQIHRYEARLLAGSSSQGQRGPTS